MPRRKLKFRLLSRTWHYICARLGMWPTEVFAKTGINHYRNINPRIRRLNNFCKHKTGQQLHDLIREAEDAISLAELMEILGRSRRDIWRLIIRNKIEPISSFPYMYIYWQDILSIFGAKDIADHLKQHPLLLWRRSNRLSIANAATKLNLPIEDYLKIEAGQLPDPPTTIIGDVDFTDWYQAYQNL